MDKLWAPIYDEHWGATIDRTHRSFVERTLLYCPPGSRILDAGCGTGKYWSLLLADDRSVFGVDQSAGMLAEARRKYPGVQTQKIGLQELAFEAAFDAIVCIDAMEYVFPEDWPRVLANFRRALRRGALYFTVELAEVDLEAAFHSARADGWPVVEGELYDDGGYHYYPPIDSCAPGPMSPASASWRRASAMITITSSARKDPTRNWGVSE